jgi:hypothetical protein
MEQGRGVPSRCGVTLFLTDRSMESFGRGLAHEEMAYIFGKVRQFVVKSLP